MNEHLPAFVLNQAWIKRMEFVKRHYTKMCASHETVVISEESAAGTSLISIYYQTIRDKKHIDCRFGISPALLVILSDLAVETILDELMWYFRSRK